MDAVSPPDGIGTVRTLLHLAPEDRPQPPPAARFVKALFVGTMFSVIPILLSNWILTRGEGRLHPFAPAAAIPVIATAFALLRPKERWYALGTDGVAAGERFFGQVRWDFVRFAEVDRVEVRVKRFADATDGYRFTGYRYAFEGKKSLRLEGEVEEPEPRGTRIHLPKDEELPEKHELRIARGARLAWEAATGGKADIGAL